MYIIKGYSYNKWISQIQYPSLLDVLKEKEEQQEVLKKKFFSLIKLLKK